MTKPSPMDTPHADENSNAANTDALLAWLPLLAKAEEMEHMKKAEDEPLRYASPPCYLAEFPDTEGTDHAAK